MKKRHISYSAIICSRFLSRPWGVIGLVVLVLFFLTALYAPFLASSLPLIAIYDDTIYFPLFRYLLSQTFFTKKLDIFFNLLGIFFIPFMLAFFLKAVVRRSIQGLLLLLFLLSYGFFGFYFVYDPAISQELNIEKQRAYLEVKRDREAFFHPREPSLLPSWDFDLQHMNDYAKLRLLLKEKQKLEHHANLIELLQKEGHYDVVPYSPLEISQDRDQKAKERFQKILRRDASQYAVHRKEEKELYAELLKEPVTTKSQKDRLYQLQEDNERYEEIQNRLQYIYDKKNWISYNLDKLSFVVMPLFRNFHWEDDAGGEQSLNMLLPFYEQTRITHKDLVAGLIFGSRISLFVGFFAVFLALTIGVFFGLATGYYGGRIDLFSSRFVEVWESMPAFFMLLLIVTILQTKSIFIIISIIALFGWTQIFRFVRAETFRERELPYVEGAKALGFSDMRILSCHILPNALLAVMALLPFDIMVAITQEAGLAFLGLGEEQSCSWGVLMEEGRSAFPAESALLWPPAIALTTLLIAIAFVGASLQWAMNPKAESE